MNLFVAKRHKRLWIIDRQTNEAISTPPDLCQLPSRVPLHHLAFDLMRIGRRDIGRIAAFEWEFSKRNVHRTRNCGSVPVVVFETRALDTENAGQGSAG
jgi:hypothetical protein